MAELVGIFAASHTPVMLNFPEAIPEEDRTTIFNAFKELGTKIAETRPDVVIAVCDDHVHNFFFDNFPSFCIGAATSYPTPVEHWLKAEKRTLRGDPALGAHLIGEAMEGGFDPSFSLDLTLDHGILTPLILAGVSEDIAVVPLLVNCVQPPLPTMKRCVQWGRFLAQAIRSYGGTERIAILATGGISHDIATARMGMVNEAFDREFLARLEQGEESALLDYSIHHVHEAGNGTEEIRNWLVGYGAAEGAPFQTLYYQAVAKWYTGIGLGYWQLRP